MKKIKFVMGLLCTLLTVPVFGSGVKAAFEPTVEASYNTAVQGQDALDGLDVSVKEITVNGTTNVSAEKDVTILVSGIRGSRLQADIQIDTDEGKTESFYRDGYFYTTASDGKIKREMERSDIWGMINSHIYMDMTSNYLKMLCSETDSSGTVTYRFAATEESLGDYSRKLLEGAGEDQGLVIDSLYGSMQTDSEGHILNRNLQLIYTVTGGTDSETFLTQSEAVFRQEGQSVNVSLPDLSAYKEQKTEKPVETITPLVQTVYTTEDVNVRAAGNLSAVILGGLGAGSGVTETGYTSDGWIQVQYNGAVGYIWGEYISTEKPVLTKKGSGTMYATVGVNIRSSYSSDSAVIGVLEKGQGIEITGTTSNGWVRVKYYGGTGYIYNEYLSWSEPVAESYVKNGCMSGTVKDASYGSLTIERDDGLGTAMFNTVYAVMNLKDTICTGDWVEIFYYGSGTPYTASQVNNYTRHTGSVSARSVSVEGVVAKLSPDWMEVTCSDGIYRTFSLSNTDFEMPDALYEGKYVIVSWMSSTNGSETRNIDALRVRGA